MKIELSKDEIETIDWAVSYLIEDIKNKFNMLCDKMDKENEAQEIS